MIDTLIRGGTVVDGSGGPAYTADVAIDAGRIVAVGRYSGTARHEIDADGAMVTPGFVDVHTHYDGQFIWDDRLDPSFSHGVTTAIGGNCGVGFAPVKPEFRHKLVELMEGVEEIPGVVLDEGLDWQWRSFPDYLDRLDQRHYSMDIACHVTHAPLRLFVMGDRALDHQAATTEDIAEMAGLVREAMAAGAIGFSGARVLEHHSSTGANVPGTFAADDELLELARAMGAAGHGTFQIIPLGANGDLMYEDLGREGRMAEHARIERIARVSGRPVTYTLNQFRSDPGDWRALLAESERCRDDGLTVVPQVAARGVGAMTMLDGYHIFMMRASYLEIAGLPLAERVNALRDPTRKVAILSQSSDPAAVAADQKLGAFIDILAARIADIYPMAGTIDYEPDPDTKLKVLARHAGLSLMMRASYLEIAGLPLAERVNALRDPTRKAAILSQSSDPAAVAADQKLGAFIDILAARIADIYPMAGTIDYEPDPDTKLKVLAQHAGLSLEEYLYDHYTAGDGTNVCLSFVLNFASGNLDPTFEMLQSPLTASGLADGGAHMRMICDASMPTFQLSYWTRDRRRGPKLPVEQVVRKLSARNAELYGLKDRGRIAAGMRADINVIDYGSLDVLMPRMAFDLPLGSPRILQGSQGYLATLVGGEVTRCDGADTGERPGRLVRGGR